MVPARGVFLCAMRIILTAHINLWRYCILPAPATGVTSYSGLYTLLAALLPFLLTFYPHSLTMLLDPTWWRLFRGSTSQELPLHGSLGSQKHHIYPSALLGALGKNEDQMGELYECKWFEISCTACMPGRSFKYVRVRSPDTDIFYINFKIFDIRIKED